MNNNQYVDASRWVLLTAPLRWAEETKNLCGHSEVGSVVELLRGVYWDRNAVSRSFAEPGGALLCTCIAVYVLAAALYLHCCLCLGCCFVPALLFMSRLLLCTCIAVYVSAAAWYLHCCLCFG